MHQESRNVDIVIGGQYGDEGKGTITAMMAYAEHYPVLVRTGGENAEHRVQRPDGELIYHHVLPSALAVAHHHGNAHTVVLPAGMTFSVGGLRREVDQYQDVLGCRDVILVDRNCAIITEEIRQEGMDASKARGSTFAGVGPTMTRKVARNPSWRCPIAADKRAEIEDIPGVRVTDTVAALHLLLAQDKAILVEGSQGTMLSLDHGHYPYCTSRNVTSSGVLSDAGLSWCNVRRMVMVVKALPTRVPGPSGPTGGKELTWVEARRRAGRPQDDVTIEQTPGGVGGAAKGAGGRERPFEISFDELMKAADLNGPTEIALTFLDWWDYEDKDKRYRVDLGLLSEALADNIEESTHTPVTVLRTGSAWNSFVPMGRDVAGGVDWVQARAEQEEAENG